MLHSMSGFRTVTAWDLTATSAAERASRQRCVCTRFAVIFSGEVFDTGPYRAESSVFLAVVAV